MTVPFAHVKFRSDSAVFYKRGSYNVEIKPVNVDTEEYDCFRGNAIASILGLNSTLWWYKDSRKGLGIAHSKVLNKNSYIPHILRVTQFFITAIGHSNSAKVPAMCDQICAREVLANCSLCSTALRGIIFCILFRVGELIILANRCYICAWALVVGSDFVTLYLHSLCKVQCKISALLT